MIRSARLLRLAAAVTFAAALSAATQFDAPGRPHRTDLTYDGRFTFVRLRWQSDGRWRGGWGSAWNHDYPRAEQNLSAIIREITFLDIRTDGSRILTLDDPDLFRYPIAFMWEPGFWVLNDVEARAFRAYLLKGGFAVFEDFDGTAQWANFEAQMPRRNLEVGIWNLECVRSVEGLVHFDRAYASLLPPVNRRSGALGSRAAAGRRRR